MSEGLMTECELHDSICSKNDIYQFRRYWRLRSVGMSRWNRTQKSTDEIAEVGYTGNIYRNYVTLDGEFIAIAFEL